MRHVPHLVVGSPWPDSELIGLSVLQWRHVSKVLRLGEGDLVSYTDGLGAMGQGRLGKEKIVRGEEWTVPEPRRLTMAVSPPSSKERQRFLVEKLAELGVWRLQWLETRHGKNRPASPPKAFAWVVSALEQSRGGWLMEVSKGTVGWDDLEGPVVVCDQGGGPMPEQAGTVVIGPEGGWAPDDLPDGAVTWGLGPTVLRTETAAVVAAARLLAV